MDLAQRVADNLGIARRPAEGARSSVVTAGAPAHKLSPYSLSFSPYRCRSLASLGAITI